MSKTVKIHGTTTLVQLPDGLPHNGGDLVTLTDDKYAQINAGLFGTVVDDVSADQTPAAVGNGNLFVHYTPLFNLSAIAAATLYTWTPNFGGTILAVSAVAVTPATTASKAATLTWKIATVATTGGAVALTSANMTPAYNRVNGSQVTAANVFTSGQALTLVGSSVTAFIEGTVFFATIVQKS